MARYVPKTYNNRRGLRIILGIIATFALSIVIIFLILFFTLQSYVVDGQLVHPLLNNWEYSETELEENNHNYSSDSPDSDYPYEYDDFSDSEENE